MSEGRLGEIVIENGGLDGVIVALLDEDLTELERDQSLAALGFD